MFVALALALPARADDTTEARTLYEDGLRLSKAGESHAALAAFRASYAKAPNGKILYAIGQLCARVGDGGCAVRAYERYLREAEPTAKRTAELGAEIRALSRTLGRVRITAETEGAEVRVDDEVVGKTPLEGAIAVNAGEHVVVVSDGSRKADATFKILSGKFASVALDLPPLPPKPEEKPPPPPPPTPLVPTSEPAPPPTSRSGGFPVVPWAITGALGVATGVSGVLALLAYSDYRDTRDQFPISREALDDAHGKARDLLLLTGALGAVTVTAAGVATYFTLAGSSEAAEKNPGPRVSFAVRPNGLTLMGTLP